MNIGKAPLWIECIINLHNCWIGAFWEKKSVGQLTPWGYIRTEYNVYICLIPCVQVHLWWWIRRAWPKVEGASVV